MNEFLGKFEVNEEDLKKAYKILFNEEGTFDKEKENIIKSLENCCIEAVPGSGKTTTLVAKLIILIEKMRNTSNDKGICVLTHTNVGIDIIKKKLGEKANILFKYPNYVGTLQSFIDKYLAIPNYKIMFKSPIKIIDDDWVNKMVKYKISYGLKTIIEKRQIQIDEVFFNFKDNLFYLKSGSTTKTFLKDNKKENYKLMYERINNGELKYREAIQLGSLYIKNYPILTKLFSNRFSIVIVDEMQDTNEEAFEILEQLFDKRTTIVQYIGDGKQNIMKGTDNWNKALNKLSLSKSKRFGENISDFLNKISENNEKIIGDIKVKDYKPILIVYDDLLNITNKNNKIIEKFIEIIKDKELDKIENPVFKAIGRVGRKNEKRVTISSYFPQYVGSLAEEKNTISFLLNKKTKMESENKIILKEIRKKIEKFIEKQNIEIREIDELFDSSEYKNIIYHYFKDKDIKVLLDKIKNYFKNKYDIKKFEKEFELVFDFNEENKNNKLENKYKHENITVEINTVHGVKGETHTATLYLETYYKKYDVSSFINGYLKKTKLKDSETKNILYVGSSRAKYLLCLAIDKNNIKDFEKNKEKLEENFEIHYV